jgi:hypothetical protein
MTGYGDAAVIASEPETHPEGEGSVYERLLRPFDGAIFDQTAKPMAPGPGESLISLIKRGFGRRGRHIILNTYGFVVSEPVVPAAAGFTRVYMVRNLQIAPNESSRSETVPVESSTEVDEAAHGWLRVVGKLAGLAQLPKGWDGLDAPAADRRAIDRALTLIVGLGTRARMEGVTLPEPSIGPAGLGSVQLEWQEGHRFMAVQVPATSEPLSFYAEIDDREELSDEAQPERIWEVVRAMV